MLHGSRRTAVAILALAALSSTHGQDEPLQDIPAAMDSAGVREATLAAERGGSGPYRAIMVSDPSLPTHTIYRPADLTPFGASRRLPIVVWANGACVNIGNRFRYFLTEVASHGYFVAAIGPIGPELLESSLSPTLPGEPPPANDPRQGGPQPTRWHQLVDAMDWAVAATARESSPYFGRLDVARIAVMGMSCGGLQAILASADPRTRTTMIWNSGTFPADSDRVLVGAEATKASLAALHAPIAYITGDRRDRAYPNSDDDFEQVTGLPVVRAWQHGVGHSGTYRSPNGGSFANVAVAWLDWQLKGDAAGRHWFVGDDCVLCRDETWEIRTRNLE